MKEYDAEKEYETTYLHSNSGLTPGSIQDRELRRAWIMAHWNFLAWLISLDGDPDKITLAVCEIAEKVEKFVMANTSSEERQRVS